MGDHAMTVIGPDGKDWVPGHEEIELALVKLYRVTGEQKYLDFAQWLLEETDNQGTYDLPLGGSFSSGFEPDLLGGVVSITSDNGQKFIPYYSWDNRAPSRMKVWVDCP
jgi:DUF1680 family protein